MRVKINSLLYICGIVILASTIETRKIRVRPRPQSLENEDSGVAEDIRTARVQYYAAEEPQEEQQRIILVSEDDYNGLYGQPQAQAQARALQDNYIPHSRNAPKPQPQPISQRTKGSTDAPKQPPVQTIRNYNKVNDDGSFTFGYEAADGSFKEETRGTDCVVRGKYGYVDPDGNKREFTYVSGNPCDPNAINDEDSDERKESGSKSQQEDEDTDDGQANYPKAFPVRPLRPSPSARPTPVPTRPPVTVFQNVYAQSSEEDEEEPLQVLQPQTPRPRLQSRPTPQYIARPQPSPTYQIQTESSRPSYQIQTESSRPSYQIQTESPRPAYQIQPQPTTPSSLVFHQTNSPVNITPRPSTVKAQLPATTYRPQLVAVTPRPAQVYTTKELEPAHRLFPSSTPTPLTRTPSGTIDFQAEFAKFAAQDGNAVVSTPKTLLKSTEKVKPTPFQGSEPIYSSELVYDPSSGQYKTQLYQTLPQTTGDFTLSHRIQPYVQQQQAQQPSRLVSLQQLQQQSPIYRTVPQQSAIPQQRPQPTQQLYQQQQAELQFQNSQQLYAQQQRVRAQAAQRPLPSPASVQQQPQQFYYIQPQTQNQQHALAQGQIEAFLRGHNIDFK